MININLILGLKTLSGSNVVVLFFAVFFVDHVIEQFV